MPKNYTLAQLGNIEVGAYSWSPKLFWCAVLVAQTYLLFILSKTVAEYFRGFPSSRLFFVFLSVHIWKNGLFCIIQRGGRY